MGAFAWEDPPDARGARLAWPARIYPLEERPKTWKHIWTSTPASANAAVTKLRHRVYRYPDGRFEFIARKVGDEGRVYARYLGR